MDKKSSAYPPYNSANEFENIFEADPLSPLEKQVVSDLHNVHSVIAPDAGLLMEETLNKIDSKPQSLYDKNIFSIQEIYETQKVKKQNESYVQSLLEKQMLNLKTSNLQNESVNIFLNDKNSSEMSVDKIRQISVKSDKKLFEIKSPVNYNDVDGNGLSVEKPMVVMENILNEITLQPTYSQISSEKILETVKDVRNEQEREDSHFKISINKGMVAKSNKYMLIRTIGRGNYSTVKLARHMTTDKYVAIKIIDKTKLSSKILTKVCREVTIIKQLNHPNIVKLLEVMENESILYLIMEYASGGELFDHLIIHGCMKEKEARIKFRQMISAIHYCHCKFIVHRDLKAENMLLNSKMEIKIADFGFANNYDPNSKLNTFCGSPPYAAPELFLGHRYVGPEVDVWSLGVILFTLVSGRLPFDANTLRELKEKVLNLRYEFPYFISSDCESLLRNMLTVDPKERVTLNDLMNHPWINGGGQPKLIPYVEPVEKAIDHKKLQKLISLGYDKEDILKSIHEKKFNGIYATYYLLSVSYTESNIKKSFENAKKVRLAFSEIEPTKQNRSQREESESMSEFDKTQKDLSSRSLTGTSASHLAKSFKKLFKHRHDNQDSLNHEETLDSLKGIILNKEFQKQYQIAQSIDPTASLPLGANQEALMATLNQMSWTKNGRAAMFQHNTIGSSARHKPVSEKNLTGNAPISWMSEHFPRKISPDQKEISKFTVQNVKVYEPNKSDLLDGESISNFPNTSSQKRDNIITKMTQAFIRKSKTPDDDRSSNTDTSIKKVKDFFEKCDIEKGKIALKLKPYFIGKVDLSELLKIHKSEQESDDPFSTSFKPRVGRFAFSMNTISSKDPDLMMAELLRVLHENDFSYEFIEKYLLLCWNTTAENDTFTDSVQWEMEICRIPLLYIHGVRMKRIFGSSFAYKTIALKITKSLKF